ncbi:MAG: sulfatase [Myxococcales bacterium]
MRAPHSSKRRSFLTSLAAGLGLAPWSQVAGALDSSAGTATPRRKLTLPRRKGHTPRNVILVITDDQRYDALGFMKAQSFLETPHLDALAARGVHFENAFVSTALCSPSRATILTGLYAHQHRVVDNNHPVAPELVFFPEYLKRAGYETALVGKWHMGGESDAPQRGFDHWVSFRGQGSYVPTSDGLNIDGQRVPQRGYITDELTEYALDWLGKRQGKRPFFLMLAHKAVHSKLVPAPRHQGRYANASFRPPRSMSPSPSQQALQPLWVKNQRNSVHGVEFPYQDPQGKLAAYFQRYAETLLSVDESVGALVDHLRARQLLDSTVILFMSDNGFAFGEHGLIDKRTAYEESMRIPLIMSCPELFEPGRAVSALAANLDIAPTILELAGLEPPAHLRGRSLVGPARGESVPWRDALLYEYYWERNYPQTPSLHALRSDTHKYIRPHGVWDLDELYDLRSDAGEEDNLIFSPGHEALAAQLNARLFDLLSETQGLDIPMKPDTGERYLLRRADGSGTAGFPPQFLKR